MIQNKKDKKEHIINTSLTLFKKQGFYNTTTAQIARESGIATGTLFTYFKTKEELIDQIYSGCLNEIVNLSEDAANSTEPCYEQIKNLTKQYVEWAFVNVDKFFFIDRYNNSPFRKSELVDRFYQYANFIKSFENGRKTGVFKNIPTDLAVYFWTKAINGVIEYCINHDGLVDEEYKKMVIDFMMGCIAIA